MIIGFAKFAWQAQSRLHEKLCLASNAGLLCCKSIAPVLMLSMGEV